MLTERSQYYRELASEHAQAARVHLDGLDETNQQHKIFLGMLGQIQAAVFSSAADVIDAMVEHGSGMTPERKQQTIRHRLRLASLKGDDAEVDRLIEELTNQAAENGRDS